MLKILGYTTVAATALIVGSMPTLAHEGHDRMCGGLMDSTESMIMASSGKQVLLGTSEPCPEEVAVAAVETAPVVVEPAPLPHDGMVYFGLDSADLDAEDEAMLDDIITSVKAQDPDSVTVIGYADRAGPEDYNMALSEKRAQSVAAAMVAAGIPESSINTMGHGETDLAVETEDGVTMRQNRRAAIEAQ